MKSKFIVIAAAVGGFLVLAYIMSQSSKASTLQAVGTPQTSSLGVNPITSGLSSLSALLSGLSVGSVNGNPSPVSPTVYTAPAQGPTLSGTGILGQTTGADALSLTANLPLPTITSPSLMVLENPTDTSALTASPTGVSDPGLNV
jgi:hypothetical protein